MHLKLSPEILRATYDFLCELPPYNKFNLPAGEDVQFRLLTTRDRYADHYRRKGKNIIRVSTSNVTSIGVLVRAMAHEMVHVYLDNNKIAGRHHHGVAFRAIGRIGCKHLWIDNG